MPCPRRSLSLSGRAVAIAGAALALALPACGGTTVSAPPAPRLIPGGGAGDGPIAGHLFVHVTDDNTRAPVAGAAVRVGESAASSPCLASSDSTGLASFDSAACPMLGGKQSVTASAAGYVPSTLIGVNATNVTMTLRATGQPVVDTASVTGTIAGWAALPAPAPQHNTLGIVGASQTRGLGDAANNIAQGTRNITILQLPIPANACVRNALVDDCNWRLTTRTGAQAHYAIVLDQDTKGTPNDGSDDTFTVIAWAIKTGLSFNQGDTVTGESLTLLTDAEMQPFAVSFPSPPAGLDAITALPLLDLGAAGRIVIVSPVLDLTHTMSRVPRLAGALAGARYDLLAKAQDAANKDQPATLSWLHGVNPSVTVTAKPWLPPPAALTATAGRYGFGATAGADLTAVEFANPGGDRVWSVTILDGSTAFTLPGLMPDPLPAGMVAMTVSAIQVPGVDLANFNNDDARDTLTALASDRLVFTH
jgi:hypothetical protein